MNEEIITIGDFVNVGVCASGTRRWFHSHDLDFNDFMKNGIPAQTLLATGDGVVIDAIARIRERRHG